MTCTNEIRYCSLYFRGDLVCCLAAAWEVSNTPVLTLLVLTKIMRSNSVILIQNSRVY